MKYGPPLLRSPEKFSLHCLSHARASPPGQQRRKAEVERTAGVDLALAVFISSRHKSKRYRVSILRSAEILIHTFVERFAIFMNAIAELFTGLGSVGVSELLYALR